MLAAMSDDRDRASLLRLVLSLVSAKSPKHIPEPLQTYVMTVLDQASNLARDPASQRPDTRPEAIELAVGLRARDALLRELADVHEFSRFSPELAKKLLEHLGGESVRRN